MLARSSLESSQTLGRGRALSRARAAGAAIGLLALVSFMQSPKAAEPARDYSAVTDARLVSPEARNWLMYRRTYDSWGYSPLDKINARNVQELVPVWSASTGTMEGHQSPPIVNDGTMFITTPFNQVLAFDAAAASCSGDINAGCRPTSGWATRRTAALRCTATSSTWRRPTRRSSRSTRAPARVVWDKAVEDYNGGYYMTMAPLAARGKIMVGVSGGERGIRGFVVALDAESGTEVWKTYTIPGPASRATTAGPATRGRRAARRSGSPAASIPRSGSLTGARATRGLGRATGDPATTSTRARCSRSTSRPASCAAITSITGTTRGTGTRCPRRS